MSLKMKILWLLLFCAVMAPALWLLSAARHEPEFCPFHCPAAADLPFGLPQVIVVEARGLRPPADDKLPMAEKDLDWAWDGAWRCRSISRRGLRWQRRLLLWSARPTEADVIHAVPQWQSVAAATPVRSDEAGVSRCLPAFLLALAVVLALLFWRRSTMSPAQQALRRLRREDAAAMSADELAQIVRAGLGGAWKLPKSADAKAPIALTTALSSLLTELLMQLDRERYAGVTPTQRQRRSRLELARHCLALAGILPTAEGGHL
ncbi:MAG: hypothetical protein ACOX9E_13600 [Lentisphaeria bacterium]|jgi:hypothetical protein